MTYSECQYVRWILVFSGNRRNDWLWILFLDFLHQKERTKGRVVVQVPKADMNIY